MPASDQVGLGFEHGQRLRWTRGQVPDEERVCPGAQDHLAHVPAGTHLTEILGALLIGAADLVEALHARALRVAGLHHPGQGLVAQGSVLPLEEADTGTRGVEHDVDITGGHGHRVQAYPGLRDGDVDLLGSSRDGGRPSATACEQAQQDDGHREPLRPCAHRVSAGALRRCARLARLVAWTVTAKGHWSQSPRLEICRARPGAPEVFCAAPGARAGAGSGSSSTRRAPSTREQQGDDRDQESGGKDPGLEHRPTRVFPCRSRRWPAIARGHSAPARPR